MVIVTSHQYLIASKILHIGLEESESWQDFRKNGKVVTIKVPQYFIKIVYEPEQNTPGTNLSTRHDYRECIVTLKTATSAHKIFKNLVEQIREQMPDQLYLDKALERLISAENLEIIEEEDRRYATQLEEFNDGTNKRTKKVRRARKTKRRSKKVLRKS